MIDEFALAAAVAERLIALRGGPRFDGKRWTDQVGAAHAAAIVRETIRAVLGERRPGPTTSTTRPGCEPRRGSMRFLERSRASALTLKRPSLAADQEESL